MSTLNIFKNNFYHLHRCQLVSLLLFRNNCYRASIARVQRKFYLREYQTTLVLPDGATLPLRYHEPRCVFLPVNLETCSIAERNRRLAKRHAPVSVVRAEQQLEPAFSHERYAHLLRPPDGVSLTATSSERETVAIRLILPVSSSQDSANPPTTRPPNANSSLKAGLIDTVTGGAKSASKQSQKPSSSKASSQTTSRSGQSSKPPPARRWWQSSSDSLTRALPFGTGKSSSSSSPIPKVPPKPR